MVEQLEGVERGEREERVEDVLDERVLSGSLDRKAWIEETGLIPPSLIIASSISLETGFRTDIFAVDPAIFMNRSSVYGNATGVSERLRKIGVQTDEMKVKSGICPASHVLAFTAHFPWMGAKPDVLSDRLAAAVRPGPHGNMMCARIGGDAVPTRVVGASMSNKGRAWIAT